ncbi:MAG: glycosyltransferase family 39 protein [Pyrinomonadaceae bacterium]|nr:glycosyltransferase family 39 protein [Pyrinomonadaceae bacterium]
MSQSVEVNSVESEAIAAPAVQAGQRSAARSGTRAIGFALALMFVLGFGLRLSGVSALGFAEDEINKLEAVRAYGRGDISPNAEHPMLMKALMFVSMQAAEAWNARQPANQISDEAALRFPNLLFGALTALPIFLLTAAFFDRRTALLAATLWAFGVNAITYNRIAKEDTLLVFFMLFAFYFYLRAKQTSGHDARGKRLNYGLSGAAFGLMLASKYFPHYFGLNALYHHLFRVRERQPGEPQWKTPGLFYLLMLVVFLVANPSVLLPQTWAYLQAYTSGELLTHTGYLVGDTLYKNNMSSTPFWGTPFYFYLLFLAIKVPIPIIIAFIVGLVTALRRWRHPGHAFVLLMFILWIVPYSLIGAKWLRYTLSLMPLVYILAAIGIMTLAGWSAALFKRLKIERASVFAYAAILLFFIALPAWAAYKSAPHYALYTNKFVSESTAGFYFPHDEFYDDGLREAIRYVCENAPQGAIIAHETPGVVRFYLQKFGRTDLQSRVLSDPSFNIDPEQDTYIILQRGRTYFENQEKMNQALSLFPLVYASCLRRGLAAAEVYATKNGTRLASMCPDVNL